MTFQFLQNVIPSTHADTLFRWKEFMKKTPTDPTTPGPGWSIVASSDGSSANLSSDSLNSSASLNNQKAWFVIKPPSSTKSICFQRGTNPNEWRVKYSFGGFNLSTGTATKVPSPSTVNDEVILWGSGTDASPVASNMFNGLYEGKYVFHSGASDSDGYGFYFFAYPISKLSENNSSAKLLMVHDPLASSSYDSSDSDPTVTGIFNGANSETNIMNLTKPSNYSAQYFYGSMPAGYLSATLPRFYAGFSIASYGFTMTSGQVCNPHNLKQELFPCLYFCKSTTDGVFHNGYKGASSFLFVGSGGLRNGDVIALDGVGTPSKLFINGFILPWNTSYMMA